MNVSKELFVLRQSLRSEILHTTGINLTSAVDIFMGSLDHLPPKLLTVLLDEV